MSDYFFEKTLLKFRAQVELIAPMWWFVFWCEIKIQKQKLEGKKRPGKIEMWKCFSRKCSGRNVKSQSAFVRGFWKCRGGAIAEKAKGGGRVLGRHFGLRPPPQNFLHPARQFCPLLKKNLSGWVPLVFWV